MKRGILAVAAMSAAFALFAEEEGAAVPAVATNNVAAAKVFSALPLCLRVEGAVFVKKPGSADWSEAEEGRFYPLGTSYRTERDGILNLAFGAEAKVAISGDAEFSTRPQAISVATRTIVPVSGTIMLTLPDNLPEGMFFIVTPGFTVKNPAGESVITYEDKGDGDSVTVLCKTGSLGIEGRHFGIPTMRAADEVRIRTSHDHLFTSLYGTSGNYVVNLDQGVCTREEIDDEGQRKSVVEKGSLAWHLSPKTQVIISRSVPALGERMSVHTMTFDAAGVMQNERAFSEGRVEVNSGELVAKEKGDAEEQLAKSAAEATETTAATDVEDTPAEESKSEEKSSDGETTSTEE